jgi:DNA-binding response OmpR family regulator
MPQSLQPPSVVLAEDNPSLRERIVEQLHRLGITPRVTTRGYDALAAIEKYRPELILLDGLLPDMHGFEVARFARHLDRSYRPRIAILTAIYTQTRYQNEAKLRYGIDDYLVKPVSDESLRGVIDRVNGGAR